MSEPAISTKPAHQRPELPDFWDKRFREGTTPWEGSAVAQALRDFAQTYMARHAGGQRRVLVPGCGSARDAGWLDAEGWQVTALDFSAAAVDAARATLGDGFRGQLVCADFFRFQPPAPFAVVLERAFLCALPRAWWPDYARRMAELLPGGGVLAGHFFIAEQPKGPPFGIRQAELDALLGEAFALRDDQPVTDSLPVFAGRERWQVWERR
ncbi:methyltransferase domain-containing protein [Rhodocyclus tenuis]|uniref:Thiopurine S-methyltransferase n=1 Tax=Rhodocyclus tenuis TaxID=1066 RepID=A0A840GBZ1_RHOTE|nr:methyltransferase domain-containing protein [Rhodocyclus tenuis]MBB4245779.1 thiopurine S-methyltransferase [Rhodocyclus tenuis]MBK1680630.1 SAM-dependent methyltransferase [Rhodocyclus tenuis]